MKDMIWRLFAGLIICGLALLVVFSTVFTSIEKEKREEFCSEIYPSELPENVMLNPLLYEKAGTRELETGYVKCFKYYYENHELKREEKIFPYN